MEALNPGRAELMRHKRLHRRVYTVKGPNHMWHIDGNDKLKPYGLCISGCIDGFSRRLIWLEVARTNRNPLLICAYFLQSIQDLNTVPSVVRVDRGTENCHIATCQKLLRANHEDSLRDVAVMYGSSNHNQRIERYWSYLRTVLLQDYMNLFKDYISSGVVDTSNRLHMECIAYCFLPLIRCELQAVFRSWNSHQVRKMKHSGLPSGIPNVLYEHPELTNFEQKGMALDQEILDECKTAYTNHNVEDVDEEFKIWAHSMMAEKNICAMPTSVEAACSLFTTLMVELHKLDNNS